MTCEIDCWVLGGVQFGVLAQVLFGGAVWGCCVTARTRFCEIDCRVLWGMQLGLLFEVLAAVRAHLGKLMARHCWAAVWGVLVVVLLEVLVCNHRPVLRYLSMLE